MDSTDTMKKLQTVIDNMNNKKKKKLSQDQIFIKPKNYKNINSSHTIKKKSTKSTTMPKLSNSYS